MEASERCRLHRALSSSSFGPRPTLSTLISSERRCLVPLRYRLAQRRAKGNSKPQGIEPTVCIPHTPQIYSQRSAFHIRLSEAIKHINQDQLLAVFRGLANVSITYSLLEPNAAGYLGGALLTEHRAYVYLNAARGSIERRNLPGDWRTTLARQIRRLFELTSEHIIPIDIQGETDCLVLNAPTILSNTIKFSALSLGLKVESCIVLLPENTNDSPESKQ